MTILEAQPLYIKARESMVERLISGTWKPGQMLPSEFAIAGEMGVSQGTVRKALDDMTAKGLLVRKQGRGTFVAKGEDKSILFRFYRLTADDETAGEGEQSFPESTYLDQTKGFSTKEEQSVFGISKDDQVWRFERVRKDNDQTILWEKLVLPCTKFPDFTENTELPNNVYKFYHVQCGIIVARVKEQLRAIPAPANIAKLLGLAEGAPLLQIDRRAVALNEEVVEWRVSLCRSDTMHYRNELT